MSSQKPTPVREQSVSRIRAFIAWCYSGEYGVPTLEELLSLETVNPGPHWVNVKVSYQLKLNENYRLTSSILMG